jgi:Second Messenger Oligonucleotide or Dinucleotide Synthetase domain
VLTLNRSDLIDQLLESSIASVDLPSDIRRRAERRYREVGETLVQHYGAGEIDGLIFPQGSFVLGTVVQPIRGRGEFDIDLVCRRDLAKSSTTQLELKQSVGDGLADYVATAPEGSPERLENRRCWTLVYPGELFHLDVIPAIPNVKVVPNGLLITDREVREWRPTNPIDYTTWFHSRMAREFTEARTTLAKQMDIDPVPEWAVKTTLQRTVQALKRHRDIHFDSSSPDRDETLRPASILLTTLAGRAFEGGDDLYEVLRQVVGVIPGLIETRGNELWVPNPVDDDENLAQRWTDDPLARGAFFTWATKAQEDFERIGSQLGIDRILSEVASSFGNDAADYSARVYGAELKDAREGNRLAITAAGMLTAANSGQRSVQQHTFHGDEPAEAQGA